MSLVPAYNTPAEALAAGDLDALFAINRAKYGGFTMEATDPAPPVDPPADPPADPATDPDDDPDENDPRVKRANRQAQQYRTQLRETEQALAAVKAAQEENAGVLQALRAALTGEAGDKGDDPATVLAALQPEAENLRTQNAQLQAELLVHSIAADHDGNPVALLDSRSFTQALHKLDASAADYRDQVAEAIKDAASKNANLRNTSGQGPARGGAPGAGTGSPLPPGAVTQEQFDAMGYQAKAELFQKNPDLYRRLAGS